MKNLLRLGSGSERCVAALSVSLWLCTAHCTDCIWLWKSYEMHLPGKASLSRSSNHTLTVYRYTQTAIRNKILFHRLTCTRARPWSSHAAIMEPMRREAISGYETVGQLRQTVPVVKIRSPSLLAWSISPKIPREGFSESAATLISSLPQVSPPNHAHSASFGISMNELY